MQRTILLYRVVLGLLLLAAPPAWGQPAGAPPSAPILLDEIPPATAPAMETAFPDPSTPVLDEPKDRPAAAAQPAAALNTTGALGAGGPFGGFDPRTLAIFNTSFATTWYPSEKVAGQPTHLGYLQDDFSLSMPLYHEGGDVWAASIRARNETFDTQAFLPHSDRGFPTDLWTVHFGNTYAHTFDSGWIAGGTVSVGSASDELFHSINEMTVGVNAFLRIPSGERNAWLFTLSYSPTAEVAFPIPMVAYVYNPSDYLRVNIGLPFQVMYRPTDDLTLNFSYMLLRTVHAQAAYRISPWLRAHVSYDWGNESWFLADRPAVNDRLFYYDQRVSAGLLFNVSKSFTIDLSGGYVFDRFYFEGAQYADKNNNEIDIGAGPYLSLQGRLRW